MAYVLTIVSGAACLGVLIGLISGIFFLVLTAMKWVSKVRSTLQEEELTRQKRLLVGGLLTEDFLETRKKENGIGNALQQKAGGSLQSDGEKPALWNEQSPAQKQGPSSDTVEVRERMEKMVEAMIGGPLDGTTVGQVSTHSAYKKEDSSELTGSNLKRLIKQIVDEAMRLPDIKEVPRPAKAPKDDEDFDNKSYEDILATAILNKIIENFQNNPKQTEPNPKPRLRHRKLTKTNGSDEPKSDGDWSDTSRSDQLSLTIEEYIEEVTTAVEVSEDDGSELSDFDSSLSRRIPFPESGRTVVDAGTDDENSDAEEQSTATELVTSTSSWEENWLFQKKRLRSTPNAHHPVPVPMLVPNPSEDFRALVGGVDADDLSDMSECSDSLLQDFITTEDKLLETATPHSGSGEKPNETVKVVLAHITEESFYDKLGAPQIREEETDDAADADLTEEISEQKPSETAAGDGGSAAEDPVQEDAAANDSHFPSAGSVLVSSSTDSEDSLIRCRVAEREKEKWMNPVPLPDNPYSLENIEKREQQRRRNEYFRIGTYSGESIDFPEDTTSFDEPSKKETEKPSFARDYYVNASKQPSGRSSPPFDQRLNSQSGAYTETHIRPKTMADDENNNHTSKRRIVDKSEFCLPNVRELAKQFTAEDSKYPTEGSQIKAQSKQKSHPVPTDFPVKETELDYSTTPVSEIIFTLQHAAESPHRENRKLLIYDPTQPTTQMEVLRQSDTNCPPEQTETKADEGARFNGKQVHSLTARSISKEFREGLKNNSYQKVFPRVERISSSGESDQGEVVCSRPKSSPTPSVDLKNMRKFWEEIITANSNSTKLK